MFRRKLSTYNASKVLRKYPVGGEIYGFNVQRTMPIPEYAFTAVELEHAKTGLKYLHIDRNDKNNVFSLCFKTNPTDSSGLPHILEHTVLCGSVKYPVRDPFFKMLNRSLANFMNAMTGHDYTFYPFSTTNAKDFANLRSIYCDAVFNPLLSVQDFYQEGWRLENEDPKDIKSPLTFKGVVYNEMKGQFSNASYLFYINFLNKIYPSLHISGGDPKKITTLTHEDLCDFHASRYHPANARVFSYGDLPLNEHLEFLNEQLKGFGKRGRGKAQIRQPIKLDQDKSVRVTGPVDPTQPADKQVKASLTWFVGKPQDIYETFCWRILGSLLLDGHSSLLFQNLIESGLGTDFTVNSGADSTTALNSFTVGLQGLSEDSVATFEKTVYETLQKVAKEGIDEKKVKALLRQIELSKRDKKSDFGMNMLSSLVPGWVNNVDTFEHLAFSDTVEQFEAEYKQRGSALFQEMLRGLLESPVFRFQMDPDAEYETKVQNEESERLAAKVEKLDEEDRKVIFQRGQQLMELQSKEEDLSVLPTLSVSQDIPRSAVTYPVSVKDRLTHRATDTNGLLYFKARKDLSGVVPPELLPYLPLFSNCFLNLGTETQRMEDLEDEIRLNTGGLSSGVSVKPEVEFNNKANLFWELRGAALASNAAKIPELWTKLVLETNFRNLEKLRTLIKSSSSNSMSDISSSGHSYARSLVGSQLSPIKQIAEFLGGLSSIKFMQNLGQLADSDERLLNEVVPKLEQIRDLLVSQQGFKFAIVSGPEAAADSETMCQKFLSSLPETSGSGSYDYNDPEYLKLVKQSISTNVVSDFSKLLVKVPFQVSYASTGFLGPSYLTKDSAALQVLSQLLSYKYLHKEVREKGGAYGGGVRFGGTDGFFGYYSYRDPNPVRSLRCFQDSTRFALENQWKPQDLNEAKLTIFQGIDAPMDVEDEGMLHFRSGITDAMRQQRRENLLDVDGEDLKEVAEKYLSGDGWAQAVIGPKTDDYDDSWQTVEF